MNNISKYFLIFAIILILLSIFVEKYDSQDTIRSKLESKGLPTPAFADINTLKHILKTF